MSTFGYKLNACKHGLRTCSNIHKSKRCHLCTSTGDLISPYIEFKSAFHLISHHHISFMLTPQISLLYLKKKKPNKKQQKNKNPILAADASVTKQEIGKKKKKSITDKKVH